MAEQEVCVEDAEADITDLKNVIADYECENKTSEQDYAVVCVTKILKHKGRVAALRKLIEKNQQRLSSLTALECMLTKQLINVSTELSEIDDELSKVEVNEEKKLRGKPHLTKFGTPYFRRNKSRPADNSDALLLKNIGDIRYVDLPKPQTWLDTEKKRVIRAIETEERNRQVKNVEIEMLKIKKKIQTTCDIDDEITFLSELDMLKVRCALIQQLKGNQLFESNYCKYDWFKISVIDLKGKHSPQECQAMWTNYLHPHINKGRWKKDEDERLNLLVEKHEFSNWDAIALELDTRRSAFQCMCHYQNRLNPQLLKSVWDENDDYTLTVLIKSFRKGDYIPWKKIAYCFSKCSVSNIVARWKTINPDTIKGKFSEAEDVCLIAAVRKFGTDFKKIADHFPGRTSSQLQERYRAFLKNAPIQPWSPDEDRLIWEKVKEFGNNFSHISTFFINRNRTQIRHRYYRMQEWLKKHPGEEYPACRSGHFKIAEGPDELWKKVVNVMKDNKVKFNEVNGDAIIDDSSFSSLKSKMKLRKKSGPKVGHQKTFHSVDLELANFFCCVYPQNGGRHKVNYTEEEIETNSHAVSKFLEFLCAQLSCVSENEIETDQMFSRLDQLILKKMNISICDNPSTTEVSAGGSVSAERTVKTEEKQSSLACHLCNVKHGERSYINVWHNAVPPNQTTLIGIRSIMLWRSILKSMCFPPEIKTEQTEECHQHDGVQGNEADEECSECVKEAKALFEKQSDIWKARFQSVFAWAALCSEHPPVMSEGSCSLNNEFNEINVANQTELIEHLESREAKIKARRTQKKKIKLN